MAKRAAGNAGEGWEEVRKVGGKGKEEYEKGDKLEGWISHDF